LNKLRIPTLSGIAVVLALVGIAPLVLAHSGAKGIVKERMDMMKGMADAMKGMSAMFKGETRYDPALVLEHANTLAKQARMIPEMTPAGSDDHPSEALPVIWQRWAEYEASATTLAEDSAGLAEIAENGLDETKAREQFVKLGKSCGTCHDQFRKPKE
jgi:cytochrome c556